MPGKHDPAKKFVSFSLTRTLLCKIDQKAEEVKKDRTGFVLDILEREVKDVRLTPENQEKCDRETREERKRRAASWSGYEERVAKLRAPAAKKAKAKPGETGKGGRKR